MRILRPRRSGKEGRTQDHRADDLGHGRLEDISATASTVADVVADEVGDDGGVARVVFRDAGFDLAHEVSADIGCFGVDAAAQLSKEGDEGSAERKADDPERCFGLSRQRALDERIDHPVHDEHAQQTERDDEKAGNGATAQCDGQGLAQAAPRGGGGAAVRPYRDVHAGVARDAREQSAKEEGKRGDEPSGGLMFVLEEAHDQANDDGNEDGEDGDRRILPAQESGRTDEDAAGDVLHGRGTGVSRQNVPGEPDRENDGRHAADEHRQRIKLPSFQNPLL